MLSYQSHMPAGAGTPSYEKPELWRWYSELARRILPRPTPTPAGDEAPGYSGPRNVIFVPIAHANGAGTPRYENETGVVAWYGELARRILPRPTSAPAGDKPPHIGWWDSPSPAPPLGRIPAPYRSSGASLDRVEGHPDRGTGHALRTNDDMRFAGYRNGLCRLTFSTNCLLA